MIERLQAEVPLTTEEARAMKRRLAKAFHIDAQTQFTPEVAAAAAELLQLTNALCDYVINNEDDLESVITETTVNLIGTDAKGDYVLIAADLPYDASAALRQIESTLTRPHPAMPETEVKSTEPIPEVDFEAEYTIDELKALAQEWQQHNVYARITPEAYEAFKANVQAKMEPLLKAELAKLDELDQLAEMAALANSLYGYNALSAAQNSELTTLTQSQVLETINRELDAGGKTEADWRTLYNKLDAFMLLDLISPEQKDAFQQRVRAKYSS